MKKYTERIKAKGFTLIEIIVVIAIIGILAAILVPSLLGYVRKARRTSDIASAKEIHNNVNQIITENKRIPWTGISYNHGQSIQYTNAMESFYSKKGSGYKAILRNSYFPEYFHRIEDDGTDYYVLPVCRLSSYSNWIWEKVEDEQKSFADYLTSQMSGETSGKVKIPIKYQPKDAPFDLDIWFVCYRSDDRSQIEIWVGGKEPTQKKPVPVYRVYPDPTY